MMALKMKLLVYIEKKLYKLYSNPEHGSAQGLSSKIGININPVIYSNIIRCNLILYKSFTVVLALSAQKHHTVYALLRVKHLAGDILYLVRWYLHQLKLTLCRPNFLSNKQTGVRCDQLSVTLYVS